MDVWEGRVNELREVVCGVDGELDVVLWVLSESLVLDDLSERRVDDGEGSGYVVGGMGEEIDFLLGSFWLGVDNVIGEEGVWGWDNEEGINEEWGESEGERRL